MKFTHIKSQDIWINRDLVAHVLVGRDEQGTLVGATVQLSGVPMPITLDPDGAVALLHDMRGD